MNPSLLLFKQSKELDRSRQSLVHQSTKARAEVSSLASASFSSTHQDITAATELQALLDVEMGLLLGQLGIFTRLVEPWIVAGRELNDGVKELGDLELFAQTIQERIGELVMKVEEKRDTSAVWQE